MMQNNNNYVQKYSDPSEVPHLQFPPLSNNNSFNFNEFNTHVINNNNNNPSMRMNNFSLNNNLYQDTGKEENKNPFMNQNRNNNNNFNINKNNPYPNVFSFQNMNNNINNQNQIPNPFSIQNDNNINNQINMNNSGNNYMNHEGMNNSNNNISNPFNHLNQNSANKNINMNRINNMNNNININGSNNFNNGINYRPIKIGNIFNNDEINFIINSSNEEFKKRSDPLTKSIIQRLKNVLKGEWVVFACVDGLKGYDLSVSVDDENKLISFIIDNFRFQIIKISD